MEKNNELAFFNKNFELDEVPYYGAPEHREMQTVNGCLDTAKWFFGKEMSGYTAGSRYKAMKMVTTLMVGSRLNHYHKSHDNFSGLVALAKYLHIYFEGINWDHDRSYHPRAQAYFSWAKDSSVLDWPGLFFACLASVYTCWKPYKVRNGEKMVKADNELILIVMYRAGLKNIWFCRWFGPVYDYLLKRRFGENYLNEINEHRYPRAKDHPVKVEWRRIPNGFKWWSK